MDRHEQFMCSEIDKYVGRSGEAQGLLTVLYLEAEAAGLTGSAMRAVKEFIDRIDAERKEARSCTSTIPERCTTPRVTA